MDHLSPAYELQERNSNYALFYWFPFIIATGPNKIVMFVANPLKSKLFPDRWWNNGNSLWAAQKMQKPM